jgi:hypothetical protein
MANQDPANPCPVIVPIPKLSPLLVAAASCNGAVLSD